MKTWIFIAFVLIHGTDEMESIMVDGYTSEAACLEAKADFDALFAFHWRYGTVSTCLLKQ